MCILCSGKDTSNLKTLYCCSHVTEIPIIPGLKILDCRNTQITEIPIIPGLKSLVCDSTLITEIPIIHRLENLVCNNTLITKIPIIEGLKKLDCRNTQITEIPVIPELQDLNCSNTLIIKIPVIEDTFIYSNNCYWLDISDDKLNKVIKLQKFFKKHLLIKHLLQIIPEIEEIYYTPGYKGFYLSKLRYEQTLQDL